MAEIFKDLCRSGVWRGIDEFNGIQLEILSVLATIISVIQDCHKKNKENSNSQVEVIISLIINLFPLWVIALL